MLIGHVPGDRWAVWAGPKRRTSAQVWRPLIGRLSENHLETLLHTCVSVCVCVRVCVHVTTHLHTATTLSLQGGGQTLHQKILSATWRVLR